jgi:tetratricopeptide (TPR) repeat protein
MELVFMQVRGAESNLDRQRVKPTAVTAVRVRCRTRGWKWEAVQAIEDLNRAILLGSNYPTAFNNRGCAYMASGDPDKAIRDFSRAIELRPDYQGLRSLPFIMRE